MKLWCQPFIEEYYQNENGVITSSAIEQGSFVIDPEITTATRKWLHQLNHLVIQTLTLICIP